MNKSWLHIIGVCGKTTSLVAKMFQDEGWFVTGSDHQYFSPALDFIIKNNIHHVEGFDFKHLTKDFWNSSISGFSIDENPNLVIFVESITPKNKEYMFAKNKGLNPKPFSEVLGEYLVKADSIVVVGTAGKTTTTAIIALIAKDLGLNPSYMIGADVINFDESIKNTESQFSVIEGDEFYNPKLTEGAKFLKFKPQYGVITSLGWEHQDVYPTHELYLKEFQKFVKLIPSDGLLVIDADDNNSVLVSKYAKCRVVQYSSMLDKDAKYTFKIVKQDSKKVVILFEGQVKVFEFSLKIIGDYNAKNIIASFIIFNELTKLVRYSKYSITKEKILKSINNFKGIKKRLEIINEKIVNNKVIRIIDDFGVTPNRAKNSITSLHNYDPTSEIISVYEPISGSRIRDINLFNKEYSNTFKKSKLVIIPDLSSFNDGLLDSENFVLWLEKIGVNSKHIANSSIVLSLQHEIRNRDCNLTIVFFSGYRLSSIANELSSWLSSL